MHWRRKWQPTPVFLPGESQGRGSLVGCRLWGGTESDTTEATEQQQQQQQQYTSSSTQFGFELASLLKTSNEKYAWVLTDIIILKKDAHINTQVCHYKKMILHL